MCDGTYDKNRGVTGFEENLGQYRERPLDCAAGYSGGERGVLFGAVGSLLCEL